MLGSAVPNIGQAGPGDLIFFGPLAPSEPYHVGIYIGGGQMIDAPHTGSSVRRDTVSGFGQVSAIRRLVPLSTSGTTNGSGAVYTYAQLEGVWIQAGGSAQAAPMAAAIAMAESGGNAAASNANSNSSIDRGLWQINSSHGTQSSFDVMTNARAAVAISNNGQSWRAWCTAYSDGACGSRGGVYQGAGSPYLRYYNPGVQPDFSAPINATNAAANQPGVQAVDVNSVIDCLANPALCIAGTISGAGGISTPFSSMAASILKGVMLGILNPLIQPVAGVMGVAAGGVLMLGGAWMLVANTQAGAGLKGATTTGLRIAAPELGVGMTGGERAAFRTQQTAQQRATARSSLSAQEAGQRRQAASVAYERRAEAMSTQQLLDVQAAAYKEYLRRTRPTRGSARPQGPPARPMAPNRRAIPARSRG